VYRTPYYEEKLHIVGRLDVDTEGFLLFTTDGKLTHYLISPKNDFAKKYLVRLKKDVSEEEQKEYAKIFSEGVFIGPYKNEAEHLCKSATIFWQSFNECVLSITEGKYHQVKRMFLAVGNEVTYLKRLSIGPVSLDENLKPGECRELTFDEIESLKRA
ncbi:MAG: pseudouridine synthase, partial [Treponema sp.]|nr:pseudouridine synthase [Treponema sp.]